MDQPVKQGEAAGPPPPAPPAPQAPQAPTAAEHVLPSLGRGISRLARELRERRGLRTVLMGGALVLIALILGMNSPWTLPLVIAGVLLIAVGSLGPRLSGRMAIEFGASGTVIEMRTEITPPGTVASEHNRTLPLPVAVAVEEGAEPAAPIEAEVIEGTGETIEIEVAKLEELIATAEAGRPAGSTIPRFPGTEGPAQDARRSA